MFKNLNHNGCNARQLSAICVGVNIGCYSNSSFCSEKIVILFIYFKDKFKLISAISSTKTSLEQS